MNKIKYDGIELFATNFITDEFYVNHYNSSALVNINGSVLAASELSLDLCVYME